MVFVIVALGCCCFNCIHLCSLGQGVVGVEIPCPV